MDYAASSCLKNKTKSLECVPQAEASSRLWDCACVCEFAKWYSVLVSMQKLMTDVCTQQLQARAKSPEWDRSHDTEDNHLPPHYLWAHLPTPSESRFWGLWGRQILLL